MHFSKTYAQILQDLPPELRENAIQYRQVSMGYQIVLIFPFAHFRPPVVEEIDKQNRVRAFFAWFEPDSVAGAHQRRSVVRRG